MVNYLLDTNVLSELRKKTPEPVVLAWFEAVSAQSLFISVLTIGEIVQGVHKIRDRQASKAAELEQWLLVLHQQFASRLLPVDLAVAEVWGQLNGVAMNHGKALGAIDGLLAASAIAHNLTLVTRNVSDFTATKVTILNPWELQI